MRLFIIAFTLLSCFSLYAKTFEREYTYHAGEADSKITSRAIALEQVKRLLLEEVGVYIQSSIKNSTSESNGQISELTQTDVEVLSAGITQTKVISESWNGESYILKAEIQLNEKDVLTRLDDLMNNEKNKKVLEDSRKVTDSALAEIDRLRNELEQEKDKNKQDELQKQYLEETQKLSASDLYEKGSQAFYDGDMKQAAIDLQKSADLDPNNKECWFTLALVDKLNADYGRAIDCFKKYIEFDSLASIGWVELGGVYCDKKEYGKAIEYLEKAISLNPLDISGYINLGMAYEAEAYYSKAVECYLAMMKNDEDPSFELERLGVVYGLMADYDNSIKYYNILLQSDPKNLLATMDFADIYIKKGDYARAVDTYIKADAMEPDNIWVINSMGNAYYKKGDYDNGNKCFAKSARLGDTEIQTWCDNNGISWRQ